MKSHNPSAPPIFANLAVANPTQSAIQSVLHSFPESATEQGFGERIARFMSSPGWAGHYQHNMLVSQARRRIVFWQKDSVVSNDAWSHKNTTLALNPQDSLID